MAAGLPMTYDNGAIVRHTYHAAEGTVLDVAGSSAAAAGRLTILLK